MRQSRLLYVTAPPHPRQSPEVRLLEALIKAAAVHDWGLFKSAIAAEEARILGFTSPAMAMLVRVGSSPIPAAMEALGAPQPLDALLGWFDVKGREELDFHPGIADLTQQESRAWALKLEGFSERQIATFMDRQRRPSKRAAAWFGDAPSLSVETVTKHLRTGRRKLLRVLSPGSLMDPATAA